MVFDIKMPKKLSEENKRLIDKLYKDGLNPAEISRQIKVPYQTVYDQTRKIEKLKERGFESRTEYQEHLAKQKGFESYNEYQEHRIKERGFESRTEYQEHLAKKRINPKTNQTFKSLTDYYEHLTKQNGFSSRTEYYEHLTKQRGFKSTTRYHEHLAKKRINPKTNQTFKSLTEYNKYLAKQHRQNTENKILSDLIIEWLVDHDKTRNWLARRLGVTGSTVSRYMQGSIFPNEEILSKLLNIIDSDKKIKSLDNLLDDNE